MSEVSTVSRLVLRLVAFAIGVGCVGTLYDLTTGTQKDAREAIVRHQLSYSIWNKMLHAEPDKKK